MTTLKDMLQTGLVLSQAREVLTFTTTFGMKDEDHLRLIASVVMSHLAAFSSSVRPIDKKTLARQRVAFFANLPELTRLIEEEYLKAYNSAKEAL